MSFRRIYAPNLKNPYAGLNGVASTIDKMSTDHFDRQDKLKAQEANTAWKEKVFNQNQANNQRNFDYRQNRDNVKDNQWEQVFNKPSYNTFTTTDSEGKPVLSIFDKTNGTIKNTNAPVYQAPKVMSPEQKSYYDAKTEDLKLKQNERVMKMLFENEAYNELNEKDQLSAQEYVRQNGAVPTFAYDDGWFGKGYYLPEVEVKPQLKQKNGSNINLGL